MTTGMKLKAFDLPCRQPIAEHLSMEEASRFEERGFLVIPQDKMLSGEISLESKGTELLEQDLIQINLKKKQRRREALRALRRGTGPRPASTTSSSPNSESTTGSSTSVAGVARSSYRSRKASSKSSTTATQA